METEKLIYIDFIGETNNEEYEYDFFFSESPETAWGEDWNIQCPSACSKEALLPLENSYSNVERHIIPLRLTLVQENSCLSLMDCMDGIIKLAWLIEDNGNILTISYGEGKKSVYQKLLIK